MILFPVGIIIYSLWLEVWGIYSYRPLMFHNLFHSLGLDSRKLLGILWRLPRG